VNEGVIKAIVGHEDDSITTGRYGKSFKMEILFEAIKTLDYGLNIPALLNLKIKAAIAEKSPKG
jgi:hypothetical protein